MDNLIQYPGFIKGFKASNISSNKSTLLILTEQIIANLKAMNDAYEEKTSLQIKNNLHKAISLLDVVMHENISPILLIEQYIKFGNIVKFLINSSLYQHDHSILKDIVLDYLKVAKYTKDTRIDSLAIEIAKSFDT